jgi:hypothetical protein
LRIGADGGDQAGGVIFRVERDARFAIGVHEACLTRRAPCVTSCAVQ